jgi:pimeloyl-ACP methyl ester carboxylesterase
VAVFFVHPTSFMAGTAWNQPLDDATANQIVDERILRHQASVFNDCCEVWVPRYRQATFFSFIDTSGDGERALALAYDDVKAAFAVFLAELGPDQPFILAGHSQGTRHATALLRDTITGTELFDRMVAAYLIGFSISHDDLGSVPACENDVQIRCAVGWNAMDGEGAGVFGDTENLLCTNPLTWELGEAYAAHDLNLGAIGFPSWRPEPDEDPTLSRPVPGVADAQCYEGQLAVRALRSDAFPSRMGGNSLHPYDYSLFHMNIRENARRRVQAYLTVMASGTAG